MAKTALEVAQNLYPYTVQLRGKVSYSHVSRLVEGEELRRDNDRRKANNRIQMTRPYTALTISDPVIVDDGTVPDIIKQLIAERINTRTNTDGTVSNVWYGTSKSPNIPDIAYGAEAGPDLAGQSLQTRDTPMQGELATGLDVTIGVKFFTGNMRPGIGMDYIIVNEPVRFYQGNAIAQALAAQGVVYTAPAAGASAGNQPAPAPAAGVAPQAAAPMTPPAAAPYQAPAPGGQYAAPPAAAPVGGSGQIAEAAAAAAAAAAQAAQNQAAQQQQAAAQPMVAPPVQTQPPVQSQAPGLQYNPN